MSINLELDDFVVLSKVLVTLHENIPDEDVILYIYNSSSIYVYNIKDIYINGVPKNRFWLDNSIKKTIIDSACLPVIKYSCNSMMYPYIPNMIQNIQNENHYNYHDTRLFEQHRSFYKSANFITKLERDQDLYYIIRYGNRKVFNRLLGDVRQDTSMYRFISVLKEGLISQNTQECKDSLDTILKSHPVVVQGKEYCNEYIKDSLKLYNYQKNDVVWMKNLKNTINSGKNTVSVVYDPVKKVFLDDNNYLLYENKLIPFVENINTKQTKKVRYYGGNIISEVGLGKTISVLCYLIDEENEYDRFVEFENDTCNYFYKRGANKSNCCIKKKLENGLFCKEHSDTLFIDKRKTKLKNLNDFNLRHCLTDHTVFDPNTFQNKERCLFKTNASIILCPNHLCDQWVREYYDKFKQEGLFGKRILLVVTYDQYKNLKFSDILFADIIIVSYNFLLNKRYRQNGGYNTCNINEMLDDLDENDDIQSIEDIMNISNSDLNMFSNFLYKNRVLDECHELVQDRTLKSKIHNINSLYKWNVSATPFSKGLDSFVSNTTFISPEVSKIFNDTFCNKDTINKFGILFRRNTREQIKDEYNGTIITENVKLLDFTQQERHIYDAHVQGNAKSNKDFLIKLCCDTSIDVETRNLVKNCKTLDEIQEVILNHNKKKLANLKLKNEECDRRLLDLTVIYERGYLMHEVDENGLEFEVLDDVKNEITTFKRRITNIKKEYDGINRTYQYLKNAVETIKQLDTCPICLDDILVDQIAITKCGHKFCQECINEFLEVNGTNKCPTCNNPITVTDIYLLEDKPFVEFVTQNEELKLDKDEELTALIQKIKSTKIGNIIQFIKKDLKPEDKCIIFSQWDSMLSKVGKILKQENVNVLYCTGTVYNRKKVISSFQTDPSMNVIFLSSENCASGTNLTAANKIIFVEPVYGTPQYRKDIENQSIGRVTRISQTRPIEVLRFIIKDTIEEDIIKDNNLEDNSPILKVLEI